MKQALGSLLFISTLALFSCEKQKEFCELPPATYKGTFQRVTAGSPGALSQVTVRFDDKNKYEGTSEKAGYPILCQGNFTVKGDNLNVQSGCAAITIYDLTLMLHGDYVFKIEGDNLEIRRDYNGTVAQHDIYRLVKQE